MDPKPSELLQQIFYDPIDQESISLLLKNKNVDHRTKESWAAKLQQMIKEGQEYAKQTYSHRAKYGRITANSEPSMQSAKKLLRPLLSRQMLVRVDGNNNGCRLLFSVCQSNNIHQTTELEKYIKCRPSYIELLKISKPKAKKLVLYFLNGSGWDSWAKEYNYAGRQPECYVLLQTEIHALVNHIFDKNTHLVNIVGTEDNVKGKVLSLYWFCHEIILLEEMLKFAVMKRFIKQNRVALIHDELIFKWTPEINLTTAIDLSNFIYEKKGYQMKYTIEKMGKTNTMKLPMSLGLSGESQYGESEYSDAIYEEDSDAYQWSDPSQPMNLATPLPINTMNTINKTDILIKIPTVIYNEQMVEKLFKLIAKQMETGLVAGKYNLNKDSISIINSPNIIEYVTYLKQCVFPICEEQILKQYHLVVSLQYQLIGRSEIIENRFKQENINETTNNNKYRTDTINGRTVVILDESDSEETEENIIIANKYANAIYKVGANDADYVQDITNAETVDADGFHVQKRPFLKIIKHHEQMVENIDSMETETIRRKQRKRKRHELYDSSQDSYAGRPLAKNNRNKRRRLSNMSQLSQSLSQNLFISNNNFNSNVHGNRNINNIYENEQKRDISYPPVDLNINNNINDNEEKNDPSAKYYADLDPKAFTSHAKLIKSLGYKVINFEDYKQIMNQPIELSEGSTNYEQIRDWAEKNICKILEPQMYWSKYTNAPVNAGFVLKPIQYKVIKKNKQNDELEEKFKHFFGTWSNDLEALWYLSKTWIPCPLDKFIKKLPNGRPAILNTFNKIKYHSTINLPLQINGQSSRDRYLIKIIIVFIQEVICLGNP